MKAIRFHENGGPEVLVYEEAPLPVPGPGEVRVRVAGSAFNPADGGIRGGFLPFDVTMPHVPGYDVSGTIDAVDGSAAQYVVAPVDSVVPAPTTIELADAAGLPSLSLTAFQALFELARLQVGQRVAINGAGGPVGGYAVQLAKSAGAYVIATSSYRSEKSVTMSGADEVIHYATTSLFDALTEPVDVLLNLAPITSGDFTALATKVADGGVVVSTTPMVPTPGDEARRVRAETLFLHPDAEALSRMVSLVDQGQLRVEIAQRLPLSDLPDVHQQADEGKLVGKVIVTPPAD
ncbi:MAG: NADP-dependent oxidoreductase [Ornithinimicrobium sp.]